MDEISASKKDGITGIRFTPPPVTTTKTNKQNT